MFLPYPCRSGRSSILSKYQGPIQSHRLANQKFAWCQMPHRFQGRRSILRALLPTELRCRDQWFFCFFNGLHMNWLKNVVNAWSIWLDPWFTYHILNVLIYLGLNWKKEHFQPFIFRKKLWFEIFQFMYCHHSVTLNCNLYFRCII